jgi:phosphatidylglycerophosphate synthase
MLSLKNQLSKTFSAFLISPNQWTFISVLFALVSSYFLAKQNLAIAIFLFVAALLSDFFHGFTAVKKNIKSKISDYLDTVSHRYIEGILLFGMLFLPLPRVLLPAYVWIFLALFGSMVTTYAKASAKGKDLVNEEMKGGFISRTERTILFLISLFLGFLDPSLLWMAYSLIATSILTNFTALQRMYTAIKLTIEENQL